ncbi:MAG: FAD-dependent oxidoreductase [Patescibacteria group bacterium]
MKLSLSQLTGSIVTFDKQTELLPGVVNFRFQPKPSLHWEAGQYYVYFMPGALLDPRLPLRPFTVSASPQEGYLQITTRIVEKPSLFKQQLLKLKPGNKVIAAGPYGFFTLTDTSKEYVFLAGGIGITAFRSILLDLAAKKTVPTITLLYANRDANILFKRELDQLAKQFPQLTVHYLIDPQRIDITTVKKYVKDPTAPMYYISGPKPMVLGVSEQLETDLNIPYSQIQHDAFEGYPWPLLPL